MVFQLSCYQVIIAYRKTRQITLVITCKSFLPTSQSPGKFLFKTFFMRCIRWVKYNSESLEFSVIVQTNSREWNRIIDETGPTHHGTAATRLILPAPRQTLKDYVRPVILVRLFPIEVLGKCKVILHSIELLCKNNYIFCTNSKFKEKLCVSMAFFMLSKGNKQHLPAHIKRL